MDLRLNTKYAIPDIRSLKYFSVGRISKIGLADIDRANSSPSCCFKVDSQVLKHTDELPEPKYWEYKDKEYKILVDENKIKYVAETLFTRQGTESRSEDLSNLFRRSLLPTVALSIIPTVATAIDQGIPDPIIAQPTDPTSTGGHNVPPSVDISLFQLKQERLKSRGGNVYVPARAKASLRAKEDFDLTTKIQEFLASDGKVFLLLGDSGAGKSTFCKTLEISLWDKYDKINRRIPLFIHLPAIEHPEEELITKTLRKVNISESQTLELKLHREFILICDGYDESQQTRNLYMSNQLNQPGKWRAQTEATILPFDENQVQDYVEQYAFLKKPSWRLEDCQQALKLIPNLQDLAKNPCLLSIALEVLPRLLGTSDTFSAACITRVRLYDELVAQWIERGKYGIEYLKELVTAIYDNQSGNPVISYSEHHDQRTRKEEFFGGMDGRHLLQEVIPLDRNGDQYRFIHKSILEYGLSLAVFDPSEHVENTEPAPVTSRRGSTSSIMSFEAPELVETTTTAIEQSLLGSPFGRRSFAYESSVLQFLVVRVQ
ncbi:hypothetical protein BGZ80_011676 [Entomortierella chlamydospora]|uniref:NACHT domain-containing protein n=1 Tax=Entomortierella chlamydospora TaxID=101097 RepID=A0A9P6N3W4_9FUNG|nr:hypothetical protein BGZ80_011676 [Entomortierella chlamydospora]